MSKIKIHTVVRLYIVQIIDQGAYDNYSKPLLQVSLFFYCYLLFAIIVILIIFLIGSKLPVSKMLSHSFVGFLLTFYHNSTALLIFTVYHFHFMKTVTIERNKYVNKFKTVFSIMILIVFHLHDIGMRNCGIYSVSFEEF